jgi:hypothetical protein
VSSISSAVTHSQPTVIRTDTSEQYILPTSNSDMHTLIVLVAIVDIVELCLLACT